MLGDHRTRRHSSADPDALLPGGSGIIGPDGQSMAGPAGDEGRSPTATSILSRLPGEYQALDSAGHYNRPDIFALTVDTRARPAVAWLGDAPGADEPTIP